MAGFCIKTGSIWKVRTKYLKNKIKEKSFSNAEDRKYINDLIWLEELIAEGVHDYGSAVAFNSLKSKHYEEALEIKKELKCPKIDVKVELEKRRKANMKAKKEREIIEQREEEREKKQWLSLGGEP